MRPCTLGELGELVEFVSVAFGKKDRRWFANCMTHLFLPRASSARCHRMVRDSRGIAGVIGIYPLKFKVRSAVLSVGGVGSVATRSDLRGKGLMSAMLRDTVRALERGGYDISWLGGDRYRYGNYGWDHGGGNTTFVFSEKDIVRRLPDIRAARPRKANSADIPDMARLQRRAPVRVVRPYASWPLHMRRRGFGFEIARRERRAAYLAFDTGNPERIHELGGAPHDVVALLLGHMRRHGKKWVNVPMAPGDTPLSRFFFRIATTYRMGHNHQFRIVNVDSAWKKLCPEIVACGAVVGRADGARMLRSVRRRQDRELVLKRALGALQDLPPLPRRLRKLEWVRPVGWWLSAVDGV
jgi:hypothetical protein